MDKSYLIAAMMQVDLERKEIRLQQLWSNRGVREALQAEVKRTGSCLTLGGQAPTAAG